MDDCNLQKLSIKPGKLTPAFNMSTLEYDVSFGSGVDKMTITCMARDTGASYSISNSDGGKTVALKEGAITDVKIEVTAEDGTSKIYVIHAKRFSASDAALSDLKIDVGILEPEFSPQFFEYNATVPADKEALLITPSVPDAKATIFINGQSVDLPKKLNFGATVAIIQVTSPDGSNKKDYILAVTKKQIPRYIKFADQQDVDRFECPVSLSPLYKPITIRDSGYSFCGPVLDELVKMNKLNPLTEMPLSGDWKIEDYDLDSKLSNVSGFIPLSNGENSKTLKICELGTIIKDCKKKATLNASEVKYSTEASFKHKIEVRKWEKQMRTIFDDLTVPQFCKEAEKHIDSYFKMLPRPGIRERFEHGKSPLDELSTAACYYASAIQQKPSDANLHLQLGWVLEEKYYAIDLFGLSIEEDSDHFAGAAGLNKAAKESSKEEECDAICALRGVTANAPLGSKLKAIDQEYHHLIENNQGARAEHVMGLFQWKSKQAAQEGLAATKASDEESPLGQASLKYLDALSLDEAKSSYNFHVGRSLVIQGEYSEAVKRLEAALGWNTSNQIAKFYLGFALCLRKEGVGSRAQEVIGYFIETLECVLQQNAEAALNVKSSESVTKLHAENLIRNSNIHLLRGFIELGKMLRKQPTKGCMSAQDVFHNAAIMATQVLPTMVRGDSYKQVEWVIVEAHSQLLEILLQNRKENQDLISQRCLRLCSLIRHFTIPQTPKLTAIYMKTCQILVEINPCESHALYMLGNSQLSEYENDPTGQHAKRFLEEAKGAFRASIDLEGKAAEGEVPSPIAAQKWWKDKEADKKKAVDVNQGKPKPMTGSATNVAKKPVGKGNVGTTGAANRAVPAGKQAAAKTPAKGPAAAKAKLPEKKPVTGKQSAHSCEPSDKGNSKNEKPEATTAQPAPVNTSSTPKTAHKNKTTYHARLGLARALSKDAENLEECKRFYNEVIDMAPELHEAYIESAELLTERDPLGAVDIYCKFPLPEKPTFDDAYIFGEVVRLLMKAEKYDDVRLKSNMISLGKVMGLGMLEKYIDTLDKKNKTNLLKEIYAGVNGRDVNDPDLQAFFKAKFWI